jgi:ferredoxin
MTEKYDDNAIGHFYVNKDCIACDTCTEVAPNFFKLTDNYDHAFVCQQPVTPHEIVQCKEARDTCPVAAIGPFDD